MAKFTQFVHCPYWLVGIPLCVWMVSTTSPSITNDKYNKDFTMQTFVQTNTSPKNIVDSFFSFINILFYYFMYISILPACVCILPVCFLSMEARRRLWVPWDWSYRWLQAILWVLKTEPSSSAKATKTLNLWAKSSGPHFLFLAKVTEHSNILVPGN